MKHFSSCKWCSKSLERKPSDFRDTKTGYYCSRTCFGLSQSKQILASCLNCGNSVLRKKSQQSKSGSVFCSQSCSASYNNRNKICGTRRSKLEKWLQEQLTKKYPTLEINHNQKDAIGSELDIFIPSLKLAFELNGIFHYEPIHGQKKLDKIQNNDANKFAICQNSKISLCVIDTSTQKYFKEATSHKFLQIIENIIDENLASYRKAEESNLTPF